MIGRSSFAGYGSSSSSSALALGQPNHLEVDQHHQYRQNQLLDMPHQLLTSTAADVSGENMFRNSREIFGDEFESRSVASENVDGVSGDDDRDDPNNHQPPRKKRYHRHTQLQIQEMEAFFKECPHPDDKQRKELSRELGLEPLQVKFWFQNKRTQMKNQQDRQENSLLRADNDKLRVENMRFKEALANAVCPNCGGPAALGEMSFDEHQLRVENVHLRQEIDRISAIAAKYAGRLMVSFPVSSSPAASRALELGVGCFGGSQPPVGIIGTTPEMYHGELTTSNNNALVTTDIEKQMIVELAIAAMEELIAMAQHGEPLWVPPVDGTAAESLDGEQYSRMFLRSVGPTPYGLKSEASRHVALVIMNHANLVEILMDVNQYCSVFSSIVSRAATLQVLSSGTPGNYDGAIQAMTAEFQVLSPLVPTRECSFVRYCKQGPEGIWAVVDVSFDSLRPGAVMRYHRRPSGCLIQEMPNGYSKVTWVEHVDVDDRSVHSLYRPLVDSGIAFGAKRWVSTLERQSERLASTMASHIPSGDIGVITSTEGKKSTLKLAERMVMSFCGGVSASTAHQWTTLSGSGAENVRVMTRKSIDDPGRPPGIVLNAATSFWLPIQPKTVFNFLRDEISRSKWDILSNGGVVQVMAHIANGRDHGNNVSLLRVNSANSNQSNMLILQESCTDATGSYVVYAPVDVVAMNVVLNGGDPDYVALLPSGFAVLPDGPPSCRGSGGSLLTVAFQILVDSVPTAKLSLGSVATINSLIACTVERIKAALSVENPN